MPLLFGPCSAVVVVVVGIVGIVGSVGTAGSFGLVAMADYILVVGLGTSDIFVDILLVAGILFDCIVGF